MTKKQFLPKSFLQISLTCLNEDHFTKSSLMSRSLSHDNMLVLLFSHPFLIILVQQVSPLQSYAPSALKQEVLDLARRILMIISDYFQSQLGNLRRLSAVHRMGRSVCVFVRVSERAGSGRVHLSHLIHQESVALDHMLESVAAGQGQAKTFPQSRSESE